MSPIVLCDACVFFSYTTSDIVLQIFFEGLIRLKWTPQIEEEWIRNTLRKKPQIAKSKLFSRRDKIRAVVGDWEAKISPYSIVLPDPDDIHVAKAAIGSSCSFLMTLNLKDFPGELLKNHGITVIHPDELLLHCYSLDPATFIKSARRVHSRLKNPPYSLVEWAERLRASGLTETAFLVKSTLL